ncbi:MAG: hypothetical protein VYB34_09350, partial [Planctomycetota bacterium]|nr:hypothetical protein [Planctomycetota bacterium]
EVTEGYIRLYQLQGNANVGPGSKSNGTVVDANGGDMVLLEVWRIDDGGKPPPPVPELALGVELLRVETPEGVQTDSQSFEVWNSGSGELDYTITDNAEWLRVSPASGRSSGGARNTHTASYDTAGLPAGEYRAAIIVSDAEASNDPQTIAVRLQILPPVEPAEDLFRRGDADANGAMQLTDAVFVLLYLFSGGGEPPCMEASDADDNGALQLTDAVYVLLYLFSGGDAPPAPGAAECGADTGDVDLGCGTYDTCGA